MKLKNIILLSLVAYGAWSYFTNNASVSNDRAAPYISKSPTSIATKPPKYKCDGRQHCSQMGSYEEAKFFLQNCPGTKMDGDHDGIPCERQFGY